MPARSVVVDFQNQTSQTLTLANFGLSHGIWLSGLVPPQQIPPNASVIFGSESDGVFTGTQGSANYVIGGNTDQIASLQWDNPFKGDNSYPCTCPSNFSLQILGGEGNNADVAIILTGP